MGKHHHHKHSHSRRRFLGQASCAGVGTVSLFSTLLNLKSLNAAAFNNSSILANNDYKALVCVALGGGNDSFNMLIPRDSQSPGSAFSTYQDVRGTDPNDGGMALAFSDILPLNNTDLGVHPAMTGMQSLYNSGNLSFVANVGTLIEPTTKSGFYTGTNVIPLGVYSHSDQYQQWQTSVLTDRSATGWGGKIADLDLINSLNTNSNVSMNISLSGTNIWQQGKETIEYTMHPTLGPASINGYNETWNFMNLRNAAMDNMLDASYQDVFKKTYIDVAKVSKDAWLEVSGALDNAFNFTTAFSDNDFSNSLHMVAKMISISESLGFQRQIYFVEFGGWDHHDELLVAQDEMLGIVSNGLAEFNSAMQEIPRGDCVTTFGMSEFGRTCVSNGNGTDHGWGGHTFVMGNQVAGGQILGSANLMGQNPYPDLTINSDLEIGGGVYLPTTSVDEYFVELAKWFGVPPSELSNIFPNIGNFYDVNSASMPIGFMS